MKLKTVLAVSALALSIQATASASDLSSWAVNDYIGANSAGLMSYEFVTGNMGSNITREEFCELIINVYEKITNEELKVPDKLPFEDCNNIAVSQAYYIGIVKGTDDNKYNPQGVVTRQMMADMIVNMLNAAECDITYNTGEEERILQQYVDYAAISEWAKPAMATAANYGLIKGDDDRKISPNANITREQAIVCINRCYDSFVEVKQNNYKLPAIVTLKDGQTVQADFTLTWTSVPNAEGYTVVVKNAYGTIIQKVDTNSTTQNISSGWLSAGEYSVVVGAKLTSGDEVFCVPVDFRYSVPTPVRTASQQMQQAAQQYSAAPGWIGTAIASQNTAPQVQAPQYPIPQQIMPQPNTSQVVTPVLPTVPQTPVRTTPEYKSSKASAVLAEADKYLGIKYVYGGTTPDGFDCSGFVQYVFKNCGIKLQRVSKDQYASNGVSVAKHELQPGDLVFFGSGGVVNHVGIYAGDGQMIHSPSTGKSICYTSINSNYYTEHYIGAKRVLN